MLKLAVRNFGTGLMPVVMEPLSEILDYDLLLRSLNSPYAVDALLFGQAGLLRGPFADSFPRALKDLFDDMRDAYALEVLEDPIKAPDNDDNTIFLQMALLAGILSDGRFLFHHFVDLAEPWKLHSHWPRAFYWQDHTAFDRHGSLRTDYIDQLTVRNLLVKVYAPAMYGYGKSMSVPDLPLRAIEMLTEIRPDLSRKTRLFGSAGLRCWNAADSESAAYALNTYCVDKHCLDCPIGRLLMTDFNEEPQTVHRAELQPHLYN